MDRLPTRPAAPSHPKGPEPLWRYDLGSPTWASPVAAGGIIYVWASDGSLHAVRAADGARLWVHRGTAAVEGPAALSASAVYVLDTGATLLALDAATGDPLWSTPLHGKGPVPENPTFNHRAATPLLISDILYCGSPDGGLYAIDARTGAVLWRHEAGSPVYSGVGVGPAGALLFGTMDGSAVVLDPVARRETLRARMQGPVVSTPVVAAGRLIAGSRDYLIHAFRMPGGDPSWMFSYWFSWVESTPALAGGVLYFGASDYGRVTALDPASGYALWGTEVGGMTWGTPLVTADRVFAGTAAQDLPGTVIAHEGGIVALDRATGAVLWRRSAEPPRKNGFGGYAGSLALAGDRVIAAGLDGFLICLPVR